MDKGTYEKATLILEQLDKIEALEKRIAAKYSEYKGKDEELCKLLNSCNDALTVLKEIDNNKFKQL
jgi:hypothetical protein